MCGQDSFTKPNRKVYFEFSPIILLTLQESEVLSCLQLEMPIPSDHAPSFTSYIIWYIHCTPLVDSGKLAALLVIVCLRDSMIPLYSASCSSARSIDITQRIHDNHSISQSSKFIKVYIRTVFFQVQQITMSQKEDIQEILKHLGTPIPYTIIFKRPNIL